MFEAHVLYLLRKYLGEYVEGLSAEALRISVWNGDVVLKDLNLKAEALNSLRLPVIVKAGFIGTITLKVPWKSLGKEPVIVLIDRVYVLAHPAPDQQTLKDEDREKLFQAKLQQIEEAEMATLEAARRSRAGSAPSGNSWLGSLVSTIIGNLKVTISNVHIRYEDTISNPGHPFCTGFTLSKLAAFTMDEQGNETFDTSGALDKLRKSVQLEKLALYHDSGSSPWKLDQKWEDLTPKRWSEIFQEGIHGHSSHGTATWASNRRYLLSPINGVLKYHRLGKQERHDPEIPFEKSSLVLSDVSIAISESQYYDGIKLLETFSRYKTRVDISHLRPVVPISKDPQSWWRFAVLAGLQQKKLCYWFSWDKIKHLCQLRRRYVHLYVYTLQHSPNADVSEIRQIERILDSKVIILWRLLAHAKFGYVKSKEASEQKGSWWSFSWRTSEDPSVASKSSESQLVEEKLTKEEWQAINEMLSYQPDEDTTSLLGKDLQNMMQYLVEVSIGKAAARIINIEETEIICGRFEELNVITKLYPRTIHCNVSLKSCGLSSPEGSLAESIVSEREANALDGSFIHAPIGEGVDWRLTAAIAPCHVTILKESYERFLEFVKRSNAVSPTVAMETATALQMKIEQVTRIAQEQIQIALKERSRFALDIDFYAPIVRVPLRSSGSIANGGLFLLDFGHFTLHTKDALRNERQSLYSRFYISGRDMAAFFIDDFSKEKEMFMMKNMSQICISPTLKDMDHFYSILDRCGMSVVVDQIKVPHPRYPSTRVSIQVPNLGIHFSPERYFRIMELLDILNGSSQSNEQILGGHLQSGHAPWHPVDLASDARTLVWRGLGNSLAEWTPCYLVLSGFYLYVLESEVSHGYQRCLSMAGRQVLEVPPVSIGGSAYAIAVSLRGVDIQKALESTNTLIIEFHDDESKATWLKELVQATYRASAPPAVDLFGESANTSSQSGEEIAGTLGTSDLVINGTLIETKLSIYGKLDRKSKCAEELIIELIATGGKVNFSRSESDLIVKMKLHSLMIKDELQGRLSNFPEYLACSVLSDKQKAGGSGTSDVKGKGFEPFFQEEEDCFTDAFSDFHSMDQSSCLKHLDFASNTERSSDGSKMYAGVYHSDASDHEKDLVNGKLCDVFYEAQDSNISDFVAITFSCRSPDSPLYDGIDTQMSIRMSALEFFCNRPTLVALIEFSFDLSLVKSEGSPENNNDAVTPDTKCIEKKDDNSRTLVKGLLGHGKGRVVFNLKMDVDSVCVLLNKEDGSQLAMFIQESFLLDLKVHPSCISIDGILGNMRLRDMTLGPDSRWGWLCDIRHQGVESLIKFTFNSYIIEDDDYEGYDYSLSGRLSAVRIVFLYRFVQEITSYFMELASPHTEEAIKLVDKVGGFEWLIQKYEMDGATAVKLDLSLDRPIIIVPKNSMSNDYMQLDLGQLQVNNSFTWHGCKESDPSAIHLDILHAEIHGINMAVGVNGALGKPMIREGQGILIEVRRSLRDVFRKVPTMSIKVKVGLLQGVMSDKEYAVIINCISMNLSELPNLPPSFRDNLTGMKESIRMIADIVNLNSQILLSSTVFILAVEIRYALLELCNGLEEGFPLAQITLEGLWVSYRTTSFSEADLYVTIPKFSILDIRPDTKPEMRLMLGSHTNICKPNLYFTGSGGTDLIFPRDESTAMNLESATDANVSYLTMLILDFRWRASFQSAVIRIQQPRVLVVIDFLLAITEYFVPSLGSITGREETMNPKNDPLVNSDNIILSGSLYMQRDQVVNLSPRRQLIVDGCASSEFIYDGGGGTLSLNEEFDMKGQSYTGPIVIIGRGKRLRFRNVKIENGALLRKCTYLSNGSSYSVSADDNVEISLLDNFTSDLAKQGSTQTQEGQQTIDPNADTGATSSQMSVTFEAQIVSPEFTFYDSSKLYSSDSLHIEKLLRAKMDLSFMYASKENDTWARSLVKDFTVEAGSGLVVLAPVDISGGYTSVKEKTNISITSTDICIHLSLSVASLLFKLQNEAIAALQFGNINPLASCSNFKRIWVSPKGDLPGYNLTFWRPQAPPNYAILGDCVTSRPVPPSQVVVAVSNTYGRVRKPLGFKFIASISNILDLGGMTHLNKDVDCSIWVPIPPPGYFAVGCVAHPGNQPPPNHIIYCLRGDLVTSTKFSGSIFFSPPNSRVPSSFSIWRVDNVVGSFYAHNSVDCPSEAECFNLHQILLRDADDNGSKETTDKKPQYEEDGNSSSSSSGWDILRSLSGATAYCMSTPHFERIWWDKGCDVRRSISIWRPVRRQGFAALGDCVTEGLEPPALGLVFKCDNPAISARPVQFTKVAHVFGKGVDEAFFWYPIPPPGYASFGCMVTTNDEAPNKDFVCCPRLDLVSQANIAGEPISRSSSSRGSNCWSIWKVDNQACTFLARSDLTTPTTRLAYKISDNVKPKTRENVAAELKLGLLSLSVLDNFCGTMTPLVDTTVTNINLATHGRFEAMNAVLICSIAASTFNRQLEAWEPLIEPFDGIFKMETYHSSKNSQPMVGKHIRFSATSSLNLNISAANLDTLTETIVSWGRQNDVEHKSSRRSEEAGENFSQSEDLISSALDDDDLQQVIVENKLGCDVYLREFKRDSEITKILHHDKEVSLFLPTQRFLDELNVVTKSRESRYYVAIQILESKGLSIVDDGNSQDYFCALRLLIDGKVSDQYKLFPQSARTRCVNPLRIGLVEGCAKWNELFIFEVPEKGMANLEVEVTNLASKAGKGEVIGALSIPISNRASMLKRAASIKMLQHAPDCHEFSSYPLRRKGQFVSNEENKESGALVISISYIDQNSEMNFQSSDKMAPVESDVGFLVGIGPDGPWESFSSVLPLSVVPKILDKNPIAFEVIIRNSKKCALLRSLALLVNDTDIKLEVSLCHPKFSSSTFNLGTGSSVPVTEEIFENQRYQPISGWGSKSSSVRANDPAHWSTRDYSYSCKDFFEPPLPSGWKWTSPWKIDKCQYVDSDGWAYGTDFQNFKWPPISSKSSSRSPSDFVRRRRWTRTMQQLPEEKTDSRSRRNVIAVLSPGSSTYLPWTSMIKGKDLCLQVRPCAESSHESYTWGQMFSLGTKRDQPFNMQPQVSRTSSSKSLDFTSQSYALRLNQLEKKDLLLYCIQNSNAQQYFWLSVGMDASVLHTELNAPVYDWKISISSALRLENKLPSQTEYAVWEKTTDGKMIERQNGVIQSSESAFIYSADIRKPIFLTLFVQGGWVLEKDAILILDLLGHDHASSFWMVQQQTNRRLRVSVEHDLGGTDAAPKTIRFFVPYWIQNDSPVPLSYRVVEVEPVDSLDVDSLLIPRAVKSAKFAMKNSSKSLDRRNSTSRRNILIFDFIEDVNPKFVMLSPQDYMNRSGSLSFQSRGSSFTSARVGISIAVSQSEMYCLGISLLELERKERVDFKAFASDGSYYRLSAQLKMASDRTKVIHILPRTLFINRLGRSICLSQYNSKKEQWIHPTDPPKLLIWDSNARNELLRIRFDECNWSTPFSIENDGIMGVFMKNSQGNDLIFLRVEVRGGTKSSRYEVVLYLPSLTSPYRIENRSMFLPVHVRQVDGSDDSWQSLLPNSAASFFWQDLGRQRLLEVLIDGMDPLKSSKYNIDEIMESHPMLESSGPIKALRVTIHKEGKMHVARISDWMPENDAQEFGGGRLPLHAPQPPQIDYKESSSTLDSEFHVTFELSELGLSVIDHMPEEVLYLSVQNLLISYSSGLGSGISRFKLRMDEIQVDNQLPFSPMPVLFRLQRIGEQTDFVLKFSMTTQTNNSLDFCVYPYIGLQVPDNSAFLVNIHEPIIWRLHEMFQQVKIDRISSSSTTAVPVDPIIKIGLLNFSEIRFKVSMAMSPSQRPRGVLGFWSSLMTALGNMEHMPVRIAHRYRQDVCMRHSALVSTAVSNIQKDLLSQPLQLLSGVDILGNASSALSNMSKGVAALSMDRKFIQSRQKQDSKGIEDIGDVIREGGGALAKGLFRGVTGILTKPLEGAKSSGVEGFVHGVGKGIIGAATQPVSGVLDLLSKTTEGANAVRMKISSAIMSEEQLLRKRLPRAIGGDNLLRPYDEHKAQGQVILQLAECGTFLGQVDLFKVRGKFALSDAYEDHFLLRKGKILVVTHRRVLLLQQPTNIMAQRKFNPPRDPCSVLWDVLWDDLVTMELTRGKKDQQGSLPSQLILYLQMRSTESNATRVIKCHRGTEQATNVYSSIQQALNAYGPHASKEGHRRKVPQPYSPSKASFSAEVFPKETIQISGMYDAQMSIPTKSDLGAPFTQTSDQEHRPYG
ncbi:hypothetical protein Cni_G23180 [Canna indica]|uniref:Peroxin/Ferlin domain-containing protein n=1 Tax=Canna indica TaxID=4628 RepID=A0AAQ3QNC3_9LILI|nr:hypothetical protein Cni_G23180 [Canna indica]